MIRDTGVIIYPPFKITAETVSLSFDDSARQLRFYLLYFDRHALVPFDVQVGPAPFCATTQEELTLAETGALSVCDRVAEVDEGLEIFARDAELLFESASQGGERWALATPPGMIAGTEHESFNAVTLALRNILPSPPPTVPINEIIAFREEHAETLRRLHLSIDKSIAQYGAGNEDLGFDDIKQHAEAISAQLNKAKFPFFRVNFDISALVSNTIFTAAGTALAAIIGADPVMGAGIGQSISMHRRGSSLARNSNVYPADFQYVVDVFSENLIDPPAPVSPPLGGVRPTIFHNNRVRLGLSRRTDDHRWTGGGSFRSNVMM